MDARSRPTLSILIGTRLTQLRNIVDQALRETPWRILIILALLTLIWAALYWLLATILAQVERWELVAIVANQHIFVNFFLVLAVMLAFSNAILAFTSLYGRREAGHLLSMPVQPRQVVFVKWLEGMLLSSWSFLLLGVPLMLAYARSGNVNWYYYPLFAAHFAGFVIIPATFGLLAAWAVAMYAPRRPLVVGFWCGGVLALFAVFWLWRLIREIDGESDRWVRLLMEQLSIAQQPLFPSTWSAKGIVAAMERRVGESVFRLGVVAANAAFFAWLTINIIGRTWPDAYSRAQMGRHMPTIRNGWVTELLCRVFFFYLPTKERMLVLKDMRGFLRDPTQWTQMVIMFGLLVIYAANLQRLPVDLSNDTMRALIAFLNLTVISLILATFTSRFVFPLLSLEGQQLWLLGLLPMKRRSILIVKFLFALKVTGLSAAVVMMVSVVALELPVDWAYLQLAVCLSICIGLCGLSVGLGARFPVFTQRNPARIASGFGGTLNLIASMLFVALQMGGVAFLGLRHFNPGATVRGDEPWIDELVMFGLVGSGVIIAALSLWSGARRFERLEY